MEETINLIISQYAQSLWIGFISLFITGFILITVKDFIMDVFYFEAAKASDIGFGQNIYWKSELFTVREIKFKYLVIYNKERIIRIPLKKYLEGTKEFPNPY